MCLLLLPEPPRQRLLQGLVEAAAAVAVDDIKVRAGGAAFRGGCRGAPAGGLFTGEVEGGHWQGGCISARRTSVAGGELRLPLGRELI